MTEQVLKTIKQLNRNGVRANARTVITWGEIPYCERAVRGMMRKLEKQGKVYRLRPKSGYLVA